MQKLRFSSVFWDFGGVITSSPFEAFSKFEIDNHLPKDFIRKVNSTNHKTNAWAKLEQSKISLDEFDELFKEESKSLGHEVKGGEVINLSQGKVRPEMVRALDKLKSKVDKKLINEAEDVDIEYQNEVSSSLNDK